MEKKIAPAIDAVRGAPRSAALSPPRGDIVLEQFDRRLSTISKIAAGLVIAFAVLGWALEEQQARLSPLLVAATLFLVGAAVTGVVGLRRPALHGARAPGARDRQLLTESTQNLFLELGLLAAVAWLVELAVLTLTAI